MSDMTFRIHPAINFARVGRSEDYYIAPETAAGRKIDPETGLMGGLPIKKRTKDTPAPSDDPGYDPPIQEGDLRDSDHQLKRQAARFKIFAYPTEGEGETYPNGGGVEVKVGDTVGKTVDGKPRRVKDIVWTVHVANKKANFYSISTPDPTDPCKSEEEGIEAYKKKPGHPPVRNETLGKKLSDGDRVRTLMIDAGPRAISSKAGGTLHFNSAEDSVPSWADSHGVIHTIDGYFKSFPNDHWDMFDPLDEIDTLGEITIEEGTGRLLVLGGFGRCSAMKDKDGNPPNLLDPIDNDGWFDDTSDGPVHAVLLFEEGAPAQVHGAWVIATDPGWAPQTRNVVSTWDDIFNTWVEKLNLIPDLFRAGDGGYQPDYMPSFDEDVMPIFHGAMLQQWNTNLPSQGVKGHQLMGEITPAMDPKAVIPDLGLLIRDPGEDVQKEAGVRMPLALGDTQRSFLSLTPTQFFFLKQWHENWPEGAPTDPQKLGPGEALDRSVLENCLGGRYSPGIDLTFIVRQPELYIDEWQAVGCGPFRINEEELNYSTVVSGTPFLGVGYVPLRKPPVQVQPGDLSKFMSLPWHTDYNSCATHTPDPNPAGNNTLYWSWPAQRPVNVYRAADCVYDAGSKTWNLGWQSYSVRGTQGHGTKTPYDQQQGRFRCYFDFVDNWEWEKVGFVIQGLQIPDKKHGGHYGADKFLEVSSRFESEGDEVEPWPTATAAGYKKPKDCGPPGSPGSDCP